MIIQFWSLSAPLSQQNEQWAEEYLNADVYSEPIYDLLAYLRCYTGAKAVPQPRIMQEIRINVGPSERKHQIVLFSKCS